MTTVDAPLSAPDLRALATGESHQRSLQELQALRGAVGLIAPAGSPGQELLEAEVLAALITEFGRHRPEEFGGPFGIIRATGRVGQLELCLDRRALARFARAVIPAAGSQAKTGVTGLCWAQQPRQVELSRREPPGRITLATTFARHWSAAISAAGASADPHPGNRPAAVGQIDAEFAVHLSAVLRRIVLLSHVAQLPTHTGEIDYRIVQSQDGPRLADLLSWEETNSSPWLAVRAPAELWPAPVSCDAGRSVAQSIADLAARAPLGADGPVETVLCALAAVPATDAGVLAAERAIAVAEQNLELARAADAGAPFGWVANRRRYEDSIVPFAPGPVDPPGAGALLASGLDFAALGRDLLRPGVFERLSERRRARLADDGRQAALTLLDWALAAGTAPAQTGYTWSSAAPDPQYRDDRDAELFTAIQPVPGGVALQLRAARYPDGSCRYAIQPGPDAPRWARHASPPLREGRAPSLPTAMLLAEDSAADAVAALPRLRMRDHRLVRPVPVPADAHPSLTDLITAADREDDVFDLYELFARLRSIADEEMRSPDPLQYTAAAGGHWFLEDGERYPMYRTLTGALSDDYGPAATYPGEPANTSAVNTPEYRRHLARHRYALDPFAECYLAAADESIPGPAPFSARHAAGLAALREADLDALRALDPRSRPEDSAWALPRLPAEISQIDGFFDAWFHRREPGR